MTSSRFSQLLSSHENSKVLIISKTTCWFCNKVRNLFQNCLGIKPDIVNLDEKFNEDEIKQIQDEMQNKIKFRTVPQVFIDNSYIGDCQKLCDMYDSGALHQLFGLEKPKYDYRIAIIGGGSGGISSIKNAALSHPESKFVVFDFVSPTPNVLKTKWDIGGTCVNVGCIPKKLFHRSAILNERINHMEFFQKEIQGSMQNWEKLRTNINNYIRSLNFETRSQIMTSSNMNYINSEAKIIKPHTIEFIEDGQKKQITAHDIIIASGTRPWIPSNISHLSEHVITSDDLFWCPYEPRKTLVVGGGYVALECASFLASFGYKVTVVIRQIALRGFDQECAAKVLEGMRSIGIEILLDTVIEDAQLIKPADLVANVPGEFQIKFTNKIDVTKNSQDSFNTILVATGRKVNLQNVFDSNQINISTDQNSGKIISRDDSTDMPNIYAIGDVLHRKPELTPVAIAAGKLLVNRILKPEDPKNYMDYENVATTIFTHYEYSNVGISEETACERYGKENIRVYTSNQILSSKYSTDMIFAKLIVNSSNDDVLGLHLIGSESGEAIQAYSLMMHFGLKSDSVLNNPVFIWEEKGHQKNLKISETLERDSINIFSV